MDQMDQFIVINVYQLIIGFVKDLKKSQKTQKVINSYVKDVQILYLVIIIKFKQTDSNKKDNSTIKRSLSNKSDEKKNKKMKITLDLNPTVLENNEKGKIKKKSLEFIQYIYNTKRARDELKTFNSKDKNSLYNLKMIIDSSSGCLIDHEVMKNVFLYFKEIIQNVSDKKELIVISKYLKELKNEQYILIIYVLNQ